MVTKNGAIFVFLTATLPLRLYCLDRLTLQFKGLRSFETSGTVYPQTKCWIIEDLNSKHKNNVYNAFRRWETETDNCCICKVRVLFKFWVKHKVKYSKVNKILLCSAVPFCMIQFTVCFEDPVASFIKILLSATLWRCEMCLDLHEKDALASSIRVRSALRSSRSRKHSSLQWSSSEPQISVI